MNRPQAYNFTQFRKFNKLDESRLSLHALTTEDCVNSGSRFTVQT